MASPKIENRTVALSLVPLADSDEHLFLDPAMSLTCESKSLFRLEVTHIIHRFIPLSLAIIISIMSV
jgi:hypothetical protein